MPPDDISSNQPYRPRRPNENLEDYFEQSLYPGRLHSLPDHQSDGADDIELGALALMIYLGPADAGPPPAPICEEIIRLARDFTDSRPPAERSKWLAQLVLAYGCRWRRLTESGDLQSDDVWPDALKELIVVAFNFVVHALNILSGSVRNFVKPEEDDQKGYATLIALTFIDKLPDMNGPKYEQYQSLSEWDPNKGNLYGWLQRAIQGDKEQQRRFQANWFRNGLLFPLLKEEGFLDIGPVAFRRCLHCFNENKDRHSAESEYSQDPCSKNHPYTPGSFFIFQKDLLIVPGVYQGRKFWRCATCDGYYDNNLTGCPHCGNPRPQRQHTTTLWVRKEWASAPSLSKEYLDAVEREVKQ